VAVALPRNLFFCNLIRSNPGHNFVPNRGLPVVQDDRDATGPDGSNSGTLQKGASQKE
jgi:hypothetical protein